MKATRRDREDTSIALYYRVAETLKGRMVSGRYGPGTILPSENDLSRDFNASNITLRKAMGLLVEQGLVVRRRGIGTQVVGPVDDRIPLKITGNFRDWVDSAVNRDLHLDVQVLGIAVIPCPASIAHRLHLEAGASVWEMKRLRKRNGEPVSYYLNYAPPALLQNAKKRDFVRKPFIEVFCDKSKMELVKIDQQVEVVGADLDIGAILGVSFGSSLFFVTNTYFSAKNTPIVVSQMYFRGDRYIYRGEILLNSAMRKTG